MSKPVECPLCGKELSSPFYLGQHVQKKDDPLHNGEKAQEIKEDNPENLVDEWKEENNKSMEKQDDSNTKQVNEIPTPDKPADQPDFIEIEEMEADNLSDQDIAILDEALSQGYTKIEDSNKPISQRDVK